MANIRVYELSKELDISNKELIGIANNMGIPVSSHVSSVSEKEAEKIKNKIESANGHGEAEKSKVTEQDEEVKVFRSEGEEVVERRRGDRVVLRRRRVEEPEEEVESEIEEETEELPGEIEEEIVKPRVEAEVEEKEISAEEEKVAQQTSEPEVRAESAEVEVLEKLAKDEPETDVQEEEEKSDKVFKKKPSKFRHKKEEILDEETLDELRKAFSSKVPGKRKREYLVEEKRKKRSGRSSRTKRRNKTTGRAEGSQQETQTPHGDEGAQVIPFPKKPSKRVVKMGETINVGELAKEMGVKAGDVIKTLLSLGVRATVNQSIDHETAEVVADEFGYEISLDVFEEEDLLLDQEAEEVSEEDREPRPPVVTVMGHVDHGKTTLLDSIRETNVAGGEAGGITQHIGAYGVPVNGRSVVFVDTPGHEAFTAMRARGARVTDVVVLVVAADDGVMPQTEEAVNHARAAEVPIIVAINKIDKPESNSDKVRRELSEIGLIGEDWGGDTLIAEISAKQKTGIKDLLELILLQADILELKANPEQRANGFVIEAELDRGKGPVATVIVSEGTLRVGDYVVAGTDYGRVKALTDNKGDRVDEAGPSTPVEIMGLSGVPDAGERFYVVEDEKSAKEVVGHRETKQRQKEASQRRKVSLESLYESLGEDETEELPLIIKADAQGSIEALRESVTKLSNEKCRVKIVHTGVGAISETDVALASASGAVIVGFNVRPATNAMEAAEREDVSLELHTVIYDVVNRIKGAMEGLLEPIVKEKVVGHAEVKEIFRISKVGTVAGCMVSDGRVARGDNVRVVRDGVVVFEGEIDSLKRFKDDVREVQTGYECGIGIKNFNDVKVEDTLEFYVFKEYKQQL